MSIESEQFNSENERLGQKSSQEVKGEITDVDFEEGQEKLQERIKSLDTNSLHRFLENTVNEHQYDFSQETVDILVERSMVLAEEYAENGHKYKKVGIENFYCL